MSRMTYMEGVVYKKVEKEVNKKVDKEADELSMRPMRSKRS